MISNITGFFYRTADKPPMSRLAKALYLFLGGAGAAFLVTAYNAKSQPVHQVGATAGILGMVLVGAAARVRKEGWRRYLRLWFRRDLAVAVVWGVLLYAWILDPAI